MSGPAGRIRPWYRAVAVPTRVSNPAELVDLGHYPLHEPGSDTYRAVVDAARRQMRERGAAEIEGFVSPAGVAELVRDADALAARAHASGGQGTAYLEFPDFSLPADHPRLHFADYRRAAPWPTTSRPTTRRCAGSTSGTP